MKPMKDYKRLSEPLVKIPESVQQMIPVASITEDGIARTEPDHADENTTFDKAYLFADTNFSTMDDDEQDEFLQRYCLVLNSMNTDFKIILMDNTQDMEKIRKEVFFKGGDEMSRDLNRYLEDSVRKGHAGLKQIRLFVISCRTRTIERARDYFKSIETNLENNFELLESRLVPLNGEQSLKFLFCYWNLGHAQVPDFSFQKLVQNGIDFRDLIAPQMVRCDFTDTGGTDPITLQVGDRFSRVLFAPKLPPGISPDILQKLTSGDYPSVVTLDVAPIPNDAARKRVNDLYLQTGHIIEKQQETRNRQGAWSSDVSYEVRREKEELEDLLDVMGDNNERLFYLGIYVVINAASKTELENDVTAFLSRAEGEGFRFEPAYYRQMEAFNTASPVGCRYMKELIPVLTQPLAAFTPFIVHELYQPSGIVYGVNEVSRNIQVGDRSRLANGNGLIIGNSGSGKGMEVKKETVQIYLKTDDDIIIVDPMNEYIPIADYLGGQYIDFSSSSKHYVNPLDTDTYRYMDSKSTFLKDKTMLMLSLFSQIREAGIEPEDNSIIGRVVQKIYQGLDGKNFQTPTLTTFYEVLKEQPEERAQELALSMELFVKGAMDMFARPTNISMKNRLTIFGLQDIDRSQAGLGIIIMLEFIRSRIAQNAKNGKCTWLFIDEFHVLSHNAYSSAYLEKIWREVRKLGGYCTAITQNVADLFTNASVESMVSNSEFLMLMRLKENERKMLESELGISPNLMKYISNPNPGCGLLRFGNKLIPIDGRLPKDSAMYRLFNTNFHELKSERSLKKEVKKEARDMEGMFRKAEEARNEEAKAGTRTGDGPS